MANNGEEDNINPLPVDPSLLPVIHQIDTRFWCIVCRGNFFRDAEFKSHYANFHPTYTHECEICLNRFESSPRHRFHCKRDHHRGVPYEMAEEAFGDNLFINITPQELERLEKNYYTVPANAVVVANEQGDDEEEEEYNVAEAHGEMDEEIEKRKKEQSLKGKMKKLVKGCGSSP